jgi:hypothetical protein
MVATADISESCWRKVAPSIDWVSNLDGTISLQTSRVNGSKSSYAKHQGSPQVNMPSEKAVSRGMIEFEYRKNQLAPSWPRFIIQQLAAVLNVLAPMPDASQTADGIIKLCRTSGVDISWSGMFPVEKANDYSLLEVHEKWLNYKRTWSSLENAIIPIDRQGGQI